MSVSGDGVILHLLGWDRKFVPPFIHFVRENFPDGRHEFVIYGRASAVDLHALGKVKHYESLLKNIASLSLQLRRAKRVILHGLFSSHLNYILALHAWLLRKCYWVIWGGDLYSHLPPRKTWRWRKDETLRRIVIKRLGGLVTQVPGDVDLARKWYGAMGQHVDCFVYPSNLFDDCQVSDGCKLGRVNVLIGNSADPSNNHIEIFERLFPYRDLDIQIFVPLSYGDAENAAFVANQGRALFGSKFHPLTQFMPLAEYSELLSSIDVAVFNHKRQQAMGNITTLIGMGKKVYLRRDVTSSEFFSGIGVRVFPTDELDLSKIEAKDAARNKQIVENYFSKTRLKKQLESLFA